MFNQIGETVSNLQKMNHRNYIKISSIAEEERTHS